MTKWKYCNEADFIWNGSNDDAQLLYKGKLINSFAVEDSIYHSFLEYCEETNIINNEDNFTTYCNNNQSEIIEVMEHLIRYSEEEI